MKHFTYDEWLNYVKNEVNENEREEFESHLYTCDTCLDHYLLAVAEHESSIPILSDENGFTDLVMAGISKQKASEEKQQIKKGASIKQLTEKGSPKKPIYQQAAFHYFLAAAATLILMFSGVFQSLTTYASTIESPQIQDKKPSVTEGLINKTFAWMDSLDKKEANKK